MTETRTYVYVGQNPEGHKYFKRIKVKKQKSNPLPPPNFNPEEIATTTNEPPHKILTHAQAVFEALEEKEK